MNSQLRDKIVEQAVRDARGHQADFPGEPIRGDWDSEAWQEVANEFELTDEENEELWPVYRKAVHDTVNAAIGR